MTPNSLTQLSGSGGEPILVETDLPDGEPRGVAIIAHGYLGYKDYGMFPRLGSTAADAGLIAHRFNFSHDGMDNRAVSYDPSTFARGELFERDTWDRQVFDLAAVIAAVGDGRLGGAGLPVVLVGHSRGGVSCLLAAGRWARDGGAELAGVATLSAPSSACMMPTEAQERMLRDGGLGVVSNRTGQRLRVGAAWLREQRERTEDHDVCALAGRIQNPMLIVHGEDDPTVPVRCAHELGRAVGARGRVIVVPGADHVFNTPNPMPTDAEPSEQLAAALAELSGFLAECCGESVV